MSIADLADASQELAENLDQEQAELSYEGPLAITLGKLSSNLSAQASTLRTLAVAQVIADSQAAMNALTDGTAAAKKAADNLKIAGTAIKIAGLVLSLGAAVISENPGLIISTGTALVTAVKTL
jgi:hypothetical protein